MVKPAILVVLCLFITVFSFSQSIDKIINAKEVERIETELSSDAMEGRGTFTPGIDRAADFIATEFKKAGIKPVKGDSYLQPFSMLRRKLLTSKATVNGNTVFDKNIGVLTSKEELNVNQGAGFQKIMVTAKDTLIPLVLRLEKTDGNYLVVADTSLANQLGRLKRVIQQSFSFDASIIVLLTTEDPATWQLEFKQEITGRSLQNVVGILPGKSKKDEYVIFSGHYDHLGIRKPNADGDSIYNGANDDAAGTTAVIMLAQYFAKQKNNERTIIFAAFTAEEIGGFGSQYFSQQFDPEKVMAMFNIEMIGTESKWGTNSAYITGYERTDMGKILEKNLEGSVFKFYPDPYPQQGLFYRSDNATLARQGVPAHTISTSKMDSEKYYHTQDDEIGTLDMKNMADIIKAIAISSRTIVAGTDTPSRVDTTQVK